MLSRMVSLLCIVFQGVQGILTIKFASGILDAEGMKNWVLLAALLPYLSLLDFGVSQTIIREISIGGGDRGANEDNTSVNVTVKSLLSVSVAIIGIAATILWGFNIFFSYKNEIFCFVLSALFRIYSNVIMAVVFVSSGAIIERSIRLIGNFVYVLIILYCLNANLKTYSLGVAIFTQSFVVVLIAMFSCRSYFLKIYKSKFNIGSFIRVFPNLRDWTLSFIPSLFVFNSTIYVISTMLNSTEIVEFSILYQLFFGVLTVSNIPVTLASPLWSTLYSQSRCIELNNKIEKVVLESALLSALGCVFLICFGQYLIPYIKHDVSNVSLTALMLFSFLIYVESVQVGITSACFSCRDTNYTKVTFLAGILSVTFSYIGAKLFNLEGAIGGVLIAQLLTCDFFNIKRGIRFFNLRLMPILHIIISGLSFITILFLILISYPSISNNHVSIISLFISSTILAIVISLIFRLKSS